MRGLPLPVRIGASIVLLVVGLTACRSAATPTSDGTMPTPPHSGHTMPSSATTTATVATGTAEAAVVTTLMEMLGHLEASRANLERGNWTLAQAHAAHPTAEYWAAISAELTARGLAATLRPALDASLEAAKAQASDALAKNDAARQAVRQAIDRVLAGQSEHTTLAVALADLAESTATEFGEGVASGKLVNLEEFQDAWGFFRVLDAYLPTLLQHAPATGATAVAEVRDDHQALAQGPLGQFRDRAGDTIDGAEQVAARLTHLAAELRAVFGITATKPAGIDQQLERIRADLHQALAEYRAGNTDRAYELAANAYLEGFEQLEPPLLQAGHRDLVEQLEKDFMAVRNAIREGRSPDEVAQRIQQVENGLRTVEEVLS